MLWERIVAHVCLCVRQSSATSRCSTKMDKVVITQTTPRDRPWNYMPKMQLNFQWITPNGGAECQGCNGVEYPIPVSQKRRKRTTVILEAYAFYRMVIFSVTLSDL